MTAFWRHSTTSCPRVSCSRMTQTHPSRLVSFASLKHSLRLDDNWHALVQRERDPNALDVDALSKSGKSKSGKGKSVTCWVCNKTGHMSRNGFFISSFLGNKSNKPSYCVQYRGQEWIKFNCGTGAATTALPVELAQAFRCARWASSSLRTVRSGQDIPNFGCAKFQTLDELGKRRKLEGHVTDIHKPLGSTREISMYTTRSSTKSSARSFQSTVSRRFATRVSSIVRASWLSLYFFCIAEENKLCN